MVSGGNLEDRSLLKQEENKIQDYVSCHDIKVRF